MNTISKAWASMFFKSEGKEALETPTNLNVVFELKFNDLLVGTLSLNTGEWTFAYSDVFKAQSRVRPLFDFPDIDRVYSSTDLHPFFLIRIPGSGQFKAKGLEVETNEVELLRRFGRRSIANPYELNALQPA